MLQKLKKKLAEEKGSTELIGPKNLSEIKKIYALLTYHRYEEAPEIAILAKKYNKSEIIFNDCLEVRKKRKSFDNLPNILIESGNGFYLAKLPINDPHAYFLGDITACCQSIGGNGEECTINGITSENHGFYVLLKANHFNQENVPDSPFLKTGEVDYKNFSIVGQGYAWLSMGDNLVFDSWENLRPNEDNAITVELLKNFAKKATEDKNSPITRVTIGLGGKTPEEFKEPSRKRAYEKIKVGYQQCTDSDTQSVVYCDESKLNTAKKALTTSLIDDPWWEDHKNLLSEIIDNDNLVSITIMKLLETVLKNDSPLMNWIKANEICNLNLLENYLQDNVALSWKILFLFFEKKLLAEQEIYKLFINTNIPLLKKSLYLLHQYEPNPYVLFNEKNIELFFYKQGLKLSLSKIVMRSSKDTILEINELNFFIDHLEYAENLAEGFEILKKNNLLTEENKKILIDNKVHALEISDGFILLLSNNLLDSENLNLIINNAEHYRSIIYLIRILKKFNLLTIENKKILLENCKFSLKEMRIMIIIIKHVLSESDNPEILFEKTIFKDEENCEKFLYIFEKLDLLCLSTLEREKILIKNFNYLTYVYEAFQLLRNEGSLNQIVAKFLVDNIEISQKLYCKFPKIRPQKHEKYILSLERAFNKLNSYKLLNLESKIFLADNEKHCEKIADIIVEIHLQKIPSNEDKLFLSTNSFNILEILKSFSILKDYFLLSNDNKIDLIKNIENSRFIFNILKILLDFKVLDEENSWNLVDNLLSLTDKYSFEKIKKPSTRLSNISIFEIYSNVFSKLTKINFLNKKNIAFLIKNPKYIFDLYQNLSFLSYLKILTIDRVEILIKNIGFNKNLFDVFQILNSYPHLITLQNINFIINNIQDSEKIANCINRLSASGLEVTEEKINLLFFNPEENEKIILIFKLLNSLDQLTHSKNKESSFENALCIASEILKGVKNSELEKIEVQKKITLMKKFVEIFIFLKSINFLNYEIINILINNITDIDSIYKVLQRLEASNLVRVDVFNCLFLNIKHTENLKILFEKLDRYKLLTRENIISLLENARHTDNLIKSFELLESENLLTEENQQSLIENAENSEKIYKDLLRNQIETIFTVYQEEIITQLKNLELLDKSSNNDTKNSFMFFWKKNNLNNKKEATEESKKLSETIKELFFQKTPNSISELKELDKKFKNEISRIIMEIEKEKNPKNKDFLNFLVDLRENPEKPWNILDKNKFHLHEEKKSNENDFKFVKK